MGQNAFVAGILPRTVLGELTALPETSYLDLGEENREGGMERARDGKRTEGEGKEGEGTGEGRRKMKFRGI